VADLRAPAVHAISRIGSKNRETIGTMLGALGILDGEELLIVQLWEQDQSSQSELEAIVGLDHSTVTKMLDRMQAAGFVERHPSERARGEILVALTPAGRDLRYRIEDVWQEVELRTVGGLSPTERGELLALLRRVEAHMQSTDDG
jgi:DNA-binding MarR family transcriptional regulator